MKVIQALEIALLETMNSTQQVSKQREFERQ